ncbi:hypothetical protein LRH25_27140 [Ideonella azotifigens]|uniref:Uncharacterized protein n=1 Tax=Ideonella azotifigens TaxID=513160 RepID=A0ABN1K3V5_9BURK|nr:hypothetical protein [Ideonella azotifigens]MCD2344003.1 hypothetical protein [Ideonella azotifigens]
MTVVALLNYEGVPVLIADSMISIERKGDSIPIPTLGDTRRFDLPFSIVDLRRKLVRVNENCVLGFAGTVKLANEFIAKLLEASGTTGVITQEIFESTYYEFDETARTEVGVVGFSWDPQEGVGYFLKLNAAMIDLPYLGKCFVAGSGAEAFARWLAAFGNGMIGTEAADGSPFVCAEDQAYSVLGRLVNLDSMQLGQDTVPPSIWKGYGGWYEAMHFQVNGFQSAERLTLFDLSCEQGSKSIKLTRVYLNHIVGDVNVVISAAYDAPIEGVATERDYIFQIPVSDFSKYLIRQDRHQLIPRASFNDLAQAIEKVENAVCHLHVGHVWTEESMRRQMAEDMRWELLGDKAMAIQRFVEYKLKERAESAPFRLEVATDILSLRVSREWLASKLPGVTFKSGLLIDSYD